MAFREIGASEAGLPAYNNPKSAVSADARVFNLSSYARARDALDFGLRARDPGFLSGAPLRQDLAVTGWMNQHGEVQAIGGLTFKTERFYRACVESGPLTGAQGVVFPRSNESCLVLDDHITADIAADRFHVYSAAHLDEAIELFTGIPTGVADGDGNYLADTIYGRVAAQLVEFDRALDERNVGAEGIDVRQRT